MSIPGTVLQVGPLNPDLERRLRDEHAALRLPDADPAGFLAQHGDSVVAAVTSGRTGVSNGLMSGLPSLRAVINFGVGYDTTDVDFAHSRGVAVSNTPGVLDECVADTALALLLDVFRGVSAADRFVRSGSWAAGASFPLRRKFSGARIGVLGLGRIGGAIAQRVAGFGCSVGYHNRREVPGSEYSYFSSLMELAEWSDALVVAAAGGASTVKLVDGAVLAALGPRGFLINIARGSVVDEAALIAALEEGRLGGAGLDVFEHEPAVPAALIERDDVVLLPHLGSGTVETRAAMVDLAHANLLQFLRDGTLITPV